MTKDCKGEMPAKGLADLLGLGKADKSPEGDPSKEASIAEMLDLRLDGTLPLDTTVVEALPALLGRLQRQLLPLQGKSVREALLDPTAEERFLVAIKQYARSLAKQDSSPASHKSATVIYYAAIASAFVHLDVKITSHSYPSLVDSFGVLIDEPWMPPELVRHLAKAQKYCRRKANRRQ